MSSLDDEADRQQRNLLRHDAAAQRELLAAYERVNARLAHDLDDLTRRIERARQRGEDPRVSWLHREARYQTLLAQLRERLDDFAGTAVGVAHTTQGKVVKVAPADARDLTLAAIGPGPTSATATIRVAFDTLPTAAFERMVGWTATGTPLGHLFATIAPDGTDAVRDALLSGVAAGRPVRDIAREVRQVAETPALRAMTIVRTEALRVYRDAALDSFKSAHVDGFQIVKEWIWHATRSERTCPVCLAMHGTRHPLSEKLSSHPNCRCVQCPATVSWEELGFTGLPDTRPNVETGAELFARLPEADRLAILGRARLDAYDAGRIGLQDLIRPTLHGVWGPGLRQASLSELGLS